MSMCTEIAGALTIEEDLVRAVIGEFALQLHRHAIEYRGINGDFIGENLWTHINSQAFYHLLGFLDYFAERYSWEPGDASEYLLRLGQRSDWEPFRRQMEGWRPAR